MHKTVFTVFDTEWRLIAPKLGTRLPKYRKLKASGHAVVTLVGEDIYYGPYGSPASKAECERSIKEWWAGGRRLLASGDAPDDLTIMELINL
jgi:hypothetical protein